MHTQPFFPNIIPYYHHFLSYTYSGSQTLRFVQPHHGSIWQCKNCLQQQLKQIWKIYSPQIQLQRTNGWRFNSGLYPLFNSVNTGSQFFVCVMRSLKQRKVRIKPYIYGKEQVEPQYTLRNAHTGYPTQLCIICRLLKDSISPQVLYKRKEALFLTRLCKSLIVALLSIRCLLC